MSEPDVVWDAAVGVLLSALFCLINYVLTEIIKPLPGRFEILRIFLNFTLNPPEDVYIILHCMPQKNRLW